MTSEQVDDLLSVIGNSIYADDRQTSQQIDQALKALKALDNEISRLREQLAESREEFARKFIPGRWECSKCHFSLSRTSINATTGDFGTTWEDRQVPEMCPNSCAVQLVQVTWEEGYRELIKSATEVHERLHKLWDDIWFGSGGAEEVAHNDDDLLVLVTSNFQRLMESQKENESLQTQNAALVETVKAFLAKFQLVRPRIDDAFAFRQIHGMPYNGPTLATEIEALEKALQSSEWQG